MLAPPALTTAFTKNGTVRTPKKLVVTVSNSANASLPPACGVVGGAGWGNEATDQFRARLTVISARTTSRNHRRKVLTKGHSRIDVYVLEPNTTSTLGVVTHIYIMSTDPKPFIAQGTERHTTN